MLFYRKKLLFVYVRTRHQRWFVAQKRMFCAENSPNASSWIICASFYANAEDFSRKHANFRTKCASWPAKLGKNPQKLAVFEHVFETPLRKLFQVGQFALLSFLGGDSWRGSRRAHHQIYPDIFWSPHVHRLDSCDASAREGIKAEVIKKKEHQTKAT